MTADRWLWRAVLVAVIAAFGWLKHLDDVRGRAGVMRSGSETNARLEELRGWLKGPPGTR